MLAVIALLAGAITLWYVISSLKSDLPDLSSVRNYRPPLVTEVRAADGTLMAEYFNERRKLVEIKDMPRVLIDAFLSAEDAHFYEHGGLNLMAITRAMMTNVKEGRIVQGGSTITQQVTKSLLLSPERTWKRKAKEALLAVELERRLTKDDILYLYLNQIFFGHRAYGVASACEVYFGKPLQEISLAEAAILAGLPQAPSRYNPLTNPAEAKRRQRYVLDRMLENERITRVEHQQALAQELQIVGYINPAGTVAPWYSEAVRQDLEARFGAEMLYNGGLKVETAADPLLNRMAQEAVRRGLIEHDRRQGWRGPERNEPLQVASAWLDRQEEDWEMWPCQTEGCVPQRLPAVSTSLLDEQGVYDAWVESVSPTDKSVAIRLGPFQAEIPYEEVKWAGLPDIEKQDHTLYKVESRFQSGDVIRVRVLSVEPAPEDNPAARPKIRLTLYQRPIAQAALVSLHPQTREVYSVIGGWDFSDSQFNRALQSRRQPGSAFKPFIYATALAHGYTAASTMADTPIVYEDEGSGDVWKPKNYSNRFAGVMSLRSALAASNNLIAIKLLKDLGVKTVVNFTRRFGIESELDEDLSLGLGSTGLSVLEITNAFAVFDDRGRSSPPVLIRRVTDRDGRVVYEARPEPWPGDLAPEWTLLPKEDKDKLDRRPGEPLQSDDLGGDGQPLMPGVEKKPAPKKTYAEDRGIGISPQLAYLMTNLLQSVVVEGTGSRVRALGRPVAGKTGTSDGVKDAWFIGYTPDMVAGVWMGNDDNRIGLGRGESGGHTAAPVFLYFMESALLGQPVHDFPTPDGVVFKQIDPRHGTLAGPETPEPRWEVFGEGTEPTEGPPKSTAADRAQRSRALGY